MEPRLPKATPVAIDLALDEAGAGARALVDRDATGSGSTPRSRFGSAKTWRVFAVLLVLTVGLRLPAFFVEVFNSDETFLATQAEVINEGGRLYEDATDRKPPLVPYLYAATFSIFATERALVRARRRDARGGDHRPAARVGSPPPLRRARGVVGRDPLRAGVRRVRAARRAGGELRGLHAPRDDRGGAARARAGARVRRESRSRWRRSRSRPARPPCCPCSTWSGGRAGSGASPRPRSGSRSRSRSWRSSSAPASCCSGPCSATARTSGSGPRPRTSSASSS